MRSMTGFGRAAATLPDGTEATVLVRGVNHRFLDVAIKTRDELAPLELELRRLVSERVARGHVDVLVRTVRPPGRTATLDEEVAARYAQLWGELVERRHLPGPLAPGDLLGLPGVVRTSDAWEADGSAKDALLSLVGAALAEFDATRRREGDATRAALASILDRLEEGVAALDRERAGLAQRLEAVLKERIAKLAAGVPLDEARLAQEVALLADRADISEEIDRLKAHLAETRKLLGGAGAVGKRLDHLAQELHREVNTSGAKAREIGVTKAVLELKSLVEAFKEQVQNVE